MPAQKASGSSVLKTWSVVTLFSPRELFQASQLLLSVFPLLLCAFLYNVVRLAVAIHPLVALSPEH